MRFFAGTSGFSYDEWKGSFYPEDLPAKSRLAYYASQLTTVEINNTFYRTPKTSVVEGWREQVSGDFRFVLKASQRLTHIKRLKDCAEDLKFALDVYRAMNERLGPILFQLPPNLKQDLARLAAFLELIPADIRAAFEFRNATWFGEETYALLRAKNAALVVSDVDDAPEPPLVPTADWGYFRLRRTAYTPEALDTWLARAKAQPWQEAFVFFKHEDAGTGPKLAGEFLARTR
ncbi:MAG: DUF72 domain-containing protein [Planctomycetes bacterium]|nr:DUF72 domain-containing protein [Planctomycetota bacterium]